MCLKDLLKGVYNDKENFLKLNHPDLYKQVQTYCSKISDLPFKQKAWHYDNKVANYILCECGRNIKFNRDWFSGYRTFCSEKCSNNNFKVISKKKLSSKKHYTTEEFIEKSKVVHGDKFDYSKTIYKGSNLKLIIICPIHGEFEQLAFTHLQGKDCRGCHFDKKKKGLSYFIRKSSKRHKNKYDYSLVKLDTFDGFVDIICKQHGKFNQRIKDHLSGVGCPKCNLVISRRESYWLDKLNVPNEYRHKTLKINNRRYNVDAYDPVKNIIYEFYGDYWHGNPIVYDGEKTNKSVNKKFGILYNDTINNREKDLESLGYNLVTIWEYDFDMLYNYLN